MDACLQNQVALAAKAAFNVQLSLHEIKNMLWFTVNLCTYRIEVDPRRLCADAPRDRVVSLALGLLHVIVFVLLVDDLFDAVEHEGVIVIAVSLHIVDVEICSARLMYERTYIKTGCLPV